MYKSYAIYIETRTFNLIFFFLRIITEDLYIEKILDRFKVSFIIKDITAIANAYKRENLGRDKLIFSLLQS